MGGGGAEGQRSARGEGASRLRLRLRGGGRASRVIERGPGEASSSRASGGGSAGNRRAPGGGDLARGGRLLVGEGRFFFFFFRSPGLLGRPRRSSRGGGWSRAARTVYSLCPEATARTSPWAWNARLAIGLPKSKHTRHSAVLALHRRTSWSNDPLASTSGFVGWNRTTHGVRRCPVSVRRHAPVRQSMSLTVWSPCVDAMSFPSGLNAAAIVDRGAGRSSLYVAVHRASASPSAHARSAVSGARASEEEPRAEPRDVDGNPPRGPSRPRGSSSRARTRSNIADASARSAAPRRPAE